MSLKTFILSELYRGGAVYGREIQRRFETAAIVSWASVNHSSIYRALSGLLEEGLVSRWREGKTKRNRKFYAITPRGRRHFERTLSGELSEPRTYRNPLNIAVHCLKALPAPRAVALLERRRHRLAEHEAAADFVARSQAAAARRGDARAAYERLAAERILVKTRAELLFAGSLADFLRAGG